MSPRALAFVFVGAILAIALHETVQGDGDNVEEDDLLDPIKNAAAGAVASLWGTKYDALIANSADANGVPRDVLYNLLYRESHFRDDIITGKTRSRVGALGIAQFMPATAIEELGSVDAALDPNRAIPGAARYLAKLIRVAGSIKKGVAAYNWGIGNVQRKGLDAAPLETQQYVAAIVGDNYA